VECKIIDDYHLCYDRNCSRVFVQEAAKSLEVPHDMESFLLAHPRVLGKDCTLKVININEAIQQKGLKIRSPLLLLLRNWNHQVENEHEPSTVEEISNYSGDVCDSKKDQLFVRRSSHCKIQRYDRNGVEQQT
jgi:hypothetical protein